MTKQRPWLTALFVIVAFALAYRSHVRPWMYQWGATADEVAGMLPGDELVEPGTTRTTRAITVHAPAEHVWPWLAQLGEGRGGFYSYSLLERAVGADIHNAKVIHPEWQGLSVGDTLWMARHYGDHASQTVAAIEPNSRLVLVSKPDFERIKQGEKASGSWAFHLVPKGQHTRLVVRGSGPAVGHAWFDIVHFVMEQKMMRQIRQRAATLA